MKQFALIVGLVFALPGAALAQGAAQEKPAEEGTQAADPGQRIQGLATEQQAPYGRFVTDAKGRAVYMFMKDTKGGPSTCYDACAQAWPPVLAGERPVELPEALDRSKLGTVARRDGSLQVTYGGWPLYYYVKDKGTGDVKGQDVKGFGAEWYLVSPKGDKITEEKKTQPAPRQK